MSNNNKTSSIQIDIALDENNVPECINWTASDSDNAQQTAKAMLLAFFDKENKETLKIDIWTKEMQVMEMDRFFFQTLRSLTDTYYRATNNAPLASAMQQFVQYFGEETSILPKNEP